LFATGATIIIGAGYLATKRQKDERDVIGEQQTLSERKQMSDAEFYGAHWANWIGNEGVAGVGRSAAKETPDRVSPPAFRSPLSTLETRGTLRR